MFADEHVKIEIGAVNYFVYYSMMFSVRGRQICSIQGLCEALGESALARRNRFAVIVDQQGRSISSNNVHKIFID